MDELKSPKHMEEMYDHLAKYYEKNESPRWRSVQQYIMSLPPRSLLLDIGSGTGRFLDVNPVIVDIGIELSLEQCKVCRKKNHPDVVRGSGLKLPFRDCTFDHVMCLHVLHLLPTEQDRIQLLSEAYRVLRVGGNALFSVWGTDAMEGDNPDQIVPWKADRSGVDSAANLNRFFHYFGPDEFHRISEGLPLFECLEQVYVEGRVEAAFLKLG
jgi:SAM-dependent methyltransferase